MKLKYEFEFVEIDNEYIAIPIGEDGQNCNKIIKLNNESKTVIKLINKSKSVDDLLNKLYEIYPDEDKKVIATNLCNFLNRLLKNGLLEP